MLLCSYHTSTNTDTRYKMSKLCKSCGNYYEGDHCDKCGYGDPNLKTHAADKYKKPTKPERFRTEEEKELYAE